MIEAYCDLDMLSKEGRQQHYKRLWSGKEIPLQEIKAPSLLQNHPDLAGEIITAYLSHTTFVVKVWINYDTSVANFYTDKRAEDSTLR